MTDMAHERKLYKKRMAKRAAEEAKHEKRPALPVYFGKSKKYEHDYVPPDDLDSSHRRVR
jgi:hypothetical protein